MNIAILSDFLDMENLKVLLYKKSRKTRWRCVVRLRSDCYSKLSDDGGLKCELLPDWVYPTAASHPPLRVSTKRIALTSVLLLSSKQDWLCYIF